jgi:hypothetical protein
VLPVFAARILPEENAFALETPSLHLTEADLPLA